MTTLATIRGNPWIDDTTAARIADRWNTAYPTMRTIATSRVEAYRQLVAARTWETHAPDEAAIRRRLTNAEELRLALGQLDRGTHRACTRSPGGFSVFAAYSAVRALLKVAGLSDRGIAAVYELAAGLAAVCQEREQQLAQEYAAEAVR